MKIKYLRYIVLICSFIILTYGGRLGINKWIYLNDGGYKTYIANMLPTFSCPYVSGRAGGCYLMPFQRILATTTIKEYRQTFGLVYFKGFLIFSLFYLLLGRLWCGWVCPLGFIQDLLSKLRSLVGINYLRFSRNMQQRLKIVKYLLLLLTMFICFFIANSFLGFEKISSDYSLPFCQICPAKAIMPIFEGDWMHVTVVTLTKSTIFMTTLAMLCLALFIAGSFWKRRFFCAFCPMLALMNLFGTFSFFQFRKNSAACTHCENCALVCPMDIRKVTEVRSKESILADDCILCGSCIEACPSDGTLQLKLFNKTVAASSKETLIKGL